MMPQHANMVDEVVHSSTFLSQDHRLYVTLMILHQL